jgi:hypothetical protein
MTMKGGGGGGHYPARLLEDLTQTLESQCSNIFIIQKKKLDRVSALIYLLHTKKY